MSGSTPADVLTLTTDPADALALMGDSNRVVLDYFAGPGGWSTGIADLLKADDLVEVALEWDASACLTRVANGHTNTLRADVAAYPLAPFLGRTIGGVFSPPCQTFSPAGSGSGRPFLELLCECVRGILLGRLTYAEAMARLEAAGALDDKDGNPDPRNGLILIPARVIRALLDHDDQGPTNLEWVALEQVKPAAPVFRAYAMALRELGFSAAVEVLNSADYGVPQTRERVFVLASRVRRVAVPEPTHAQGGEPESLFGPGRLPWISMAHALGWDGDLMFCPTNLRPNVALRRFDQPAPALAFGHETPRLVTPEAVEAFRAKLAERLEAGTVDQAAWVGERPATTVVGSFRGDVIAAPGYRGPGDPPRQRTPGSVRVTEAEAAVLQGFPADYAWEGSQSKHWEQIGNVVCPPVARRCVAQLLGDPMPDPLPWHGYAFDTPTV